MDTNVGTIEYDVRIHLDQITGQLNALDKKIADSGKKQQTEAQKADAAWNKFAKGSLVAVGAAAATAGAVIVSSLGGAVRRLDTLNTSSRTFENIGIGADESARAMENLDNSIAGLPTTLDDAVRGMTALTSTYGSIDVGQQLFSALNNAIIGFGGSAAEVNNAVTQLSQLPMDGPLDAQTWNSLRNSGLTPVLTALAEESGMAVNEFKTALGEGEITVGEFSQALIRMNAEGGGGLASLNDIAQDATSGIQTGFTNAQTAITRSVATLLDAIGSQNISSAIGSIGSAFAMLVNIITGFVNLVRPIAGYLAPFASGITASAVAFVTISGAIFGATKALAAFRVMMTLVTRHPIVAFLSVLAGLVAGIATMAGFDVLGGSAREATVDMEAMDRALADIEASSQGAGAAGGEAMEKMAKAADELSKRLQELAESHARTMRDLDEQAARTERDYVESLTGIVRKHQQSIRDLTKQVEDENARYNRAIAERTTKFQDEQSKEEQEHQKKTTALQNQIDFLRKYQSVSNAQQLSELQFTLARENAQYQARNATLQQRYQEDVAAETAARDEKLAEFNLRIAEEQDILNKHRDSVKAVRDVILLDEIEQLKRSRQEQLVNQDRQRQDAINNYNKQRQDAINSYNQQAKDASIAGSGIGANLGQGISDSLNAKIDEMNRGLYGKGQTAGDNFWNGYVSGRNNTVSNVAQGWNNIANYGPFALFGGGSLWTWSGLRSRFSSVQPSGGRSSGGGGGWYTGGFTGRGGRYEVAGAVHRGEYVIPKPLVNQATGLPTAEAFGAIIGQQPVQQAPSTNYSINIDASGVIVTSAQDQRKFAEVIGKRLNEIMTQKGYKPVIQGV